MYTFTRHMNALISPVGYEDDYANCDKTQVGQDFISTNGPGGTEFVDTTMGEANGFWSSNLKESLKKYLFLYGFDRLEKIRKVSDALGRQTIEQVQAYANSFIKVIYENLGNEYENELKKFLAVKINYDISVHCAN